MTRNIRKIVSVICAVALLLSLCAVSFIGSTSAAVNENDDATVTATYETVQTYDFNNSTGIAYKRFLSRVSFADGALKIGNTANGGAAWLAKDPAHATITDHGAGADAKAAAYDNLLRLEANTTYRITYKVKYLTGSNKTASYLLYAPDVTGTKDTTAPGTSAITVVESTNPTVTVPTGQTALTADTQWYDVSYVITVGSKSVNVGIRPDSAGSGQICDILVDDFKIEKNTGTNIVLNDLDNEYVFDYTDADVQAAVTRRMNALSKGQQHYSWYNYNNYLGSFEEGTTDYTKYNHIVETESYPGTPGFTEEGMKYTVGKGATLTDASKNAWASNAPIYAPAAGNDNGWGSTSGGTYYLRLRDEATYLITVKYKVTQVTTSLTMTLGALNNCVNGAVNVIPGSVVTHNAPTEDWQYLTVAIDTAEQTAFADKIIGLTSSVTSDGKWATVIVDSVTVNEKRDVQNGTAVMKYVNKDEVSYEMVSAGGTITLPVPTSDNPDSAFAGWYTSADFAEGTKLDMNGYAVAEGTNTLYAKWVNTVSVVKFDNQGVVTEQKLAVGLELPDPVRPNANLFFEGWYTDTNFTTKLTTVPDYDVTLYAKYNGTFIGFNNISHVAGQTTGSPALVADPADETNQVVKFESGKNARPNFMIPAYDIAGSEGFELKPNTTYIVSYKVKLTSADGANAGITLYQGDQKSGTDTTRTSISGSSATATSTEWTYVTNTFTTGETLYLERVKWSYQNHVFFTIYDGSNPLSVYVDDFCIAEALTEAPEGAVAINFETNSTEIPTMYGFTGETIPELSTPTLGGHEFVGWYTDKQLTVPFTVLSFGTEDITLYAKWKTVPFIVDFSDYEEGGKSERAHFETDENGNDYLDWWVQYATNNTGDTGTPYRVFLNKSNVHYTVTTGTQYTMTFKYKLLEGTAVIKPVTNGKLNGWASYKVQDVALNLNKVTEEWTEASLTFTAAPEGGVYLSLGIAGHGHIIVDDVQVTAGGGLANLYGATAMFFDSNGGETVDAMSGDPGEAIGKLPVPTKKGYAFDRWFTDAELTTPFTATTWGEEDMTLYAGWMIGKFSESFEEYPSSVLAQGISGGYKLYKDTTTGYDKANVQNGSVSIYRDGSQTGNKAFTLCRSTDLELTVGKQYTLTFYVKPETVVDAAGTISLIGMTGNTGIAAPKSTNVITTVGDLKAGEWQKVSYTFTADNKYVGISTTAGNNMYFDNFTVTLKGYTGSSTGDSSVNPMILALMVILAAGSLVVTGKKVFEK